MLDAMLAATGRLTAIAQQASQLGAWLSEQQHEVTFTRVPVAALLDRVDRKGSTAVTLSARPSACSSFDIQADADALASALVSVAEGLAREHGATAVDISALEDTSGVRLHCHTSQDAGAAEAHPFTFDAGGMGLALVSASHVLDAHGASIHAGQPGTIDIHLRAAGGLS
jgi:hypothetical protein